MRHAYGLSIPRTFEEACDPARMALLVYDMQVGVLAQIDNGPEIIGRVSTVVEAARGAGVRVFYSRHMFLPKEVSGVYALRRAMAWQHVDTVEAVRPVLLPGSPECALVPELTPTAGELVFDKITMSALAGSPLDIVLRDCRLDTILIAGVATEVGIEPTARHALDLGYLPILVTDACGHGDATAAHRALETLQFAGGTLLTNVATVTAALDRTHRREPADITG